MNNLRGILAETSNLDSDVRNIVNTILDHENIPRKKPKFVNFVKNIMRNRANSHSIDKTWELFSQALNPPATEEKVEDVKMETVVEEKVENEETCDNNSKKKKKKKRTDTEETVSISNNTNVESNKKSKKDKKSKDKQNNLEEDNSEKENSENPKSKKKQKKEREEEKSVKNLKRKHEETMDVDEGEETENVPEKKLKFDWDETISSVLKQSGEMKLKKLKKKVVSEYMSIHEGTHKTAEEIGAKFDKKLKKKKYRVLKDKVTLVVTDDEAENLEEQVRKQDTEEEVMKRVSQEDIKKTEDVKAKEMSFNNWEAANLGSSAQNEKFRRLMGIKNPTKDGGGKFGGQGRNDKKIFHDLEEGFEKARQMHFGGRSFNM